MGLVLTAFIIHIPRLEETLGHPNLDVSLSNLDLGGFGLDLKKIENNFSFFSPLQC